MAGFAIAPTLRDYRADLMAEKLWILNVACAGCRKGVAWRGAALVERFGPAATVGEIVDRLVCGCGAREGGAMITQSSAETQARDVARFEAGPKLGGQTQNAPRP